MHRVRRPLQRRSPPSPYSTSFSCTHTPPPEIYTLSLHDALPISADAQCSSPVSDGTDVRRRQGDQSRARAARPRRSEEHTSELQSRGHLVCRLLLEKKKDIINVRYDRDACVAPAPNERNCGLLPP